MSEQYAFAIGFDDVESDETEKLPDVHWTALYEKVTIAIQDSGLPPIDSERWDEFGQGRIFWGTKAECDSVKRILAPFNLYIEEARNLETGYYATPNHTYFVSDTGTIYILPNNFATAEAEALETIDAIPLDSYRLKEVDPTIESQCHRFFEIEPDSHSSASTSSIVEPPNREENLAGLHDQIASLSAELESLKVELAAKISPETYTALEKKVNQKTVCISDLESQVATLTLQVSELQSLANARVDPQVHSDLQYSMAQQAEHLKLLTERSSFDLEEQDKRFAQQNGRVVELEQRLAQAEAQMNDWKLKAEQATALQSDTDLKQQFSAQTLQVQELQQRVKQLDQQLRESSVLSSQKVDSSRYSALEQEVADKTALIADLRRTVQQQERDLNEWQTVAEAKVEWSEYQALQDELKQFKMRRKKGLLGRLFS